MKVFQLLILLFIGFGFTAFARHPILVEDDICTITNKILGHSRSFADTFSMLNRYQEKRDIWDKDFAAEIVTAVESLRQSKIDRDEHSSYYRHWAWEQGVRYLGEMKSITDVATNFLVKTMATGYPHEFSSAAWAYFRLMKYSEECFSMARKLVDDSRKRPENVRLELVSDIAQMFRFSTGYGPPSPMSASYNLEYAREWIAEDGLRAFAMLSAICVAKPGFEYGDEWMHYVRLIIDEPAVPMSERDWYREQLKKAEAMKKEREQKPKEAKP